MHLTMRGSLETRRECEALVLVAQQSDAGGAQQWPQSLFWVFGKGNGRGEKSAVCHISSVEKFHSNSCLTWESGEAES